jgi:hypothetical protein
MLVPAAGPPKTVLAMKQFAEISVPASDCCVPSLVLSLY